MKILLIISSMGAGGAERVVSQISNFWAQKGREIDILTFDAAGNRPFYDLHPSIHQSHLGLGGKRSSILGRLAANINKIYLLRKFIIESKPGVIISFIDQTNVLTILAARFLRIPVIVTEHINSKYYSPGKIWVLLRKLLYPYSDSLVAVSKGVLDCYPDNVKKKGTVISNPITIEKQGIKPAAEKIVHEKKRLIAMGRLTHQKGFDLLINAFNIIKDKYPDWQLQIWGEGPDRQSLEQLRDKLSLGQRVFLPGLTKEPYEKLRSADIFVLSSRFEGFGIVLCEAMACGLPVVSFDCPSGPGEIIRNGIDGILVPPEDVGTLASALDKLMGSEHERTRLSSRAPEVRDRFGIEKIMAQWDNLLNKFNYGNKIT